MSAEWCSVCSEQWCVACVLCLMWLLTLWLRAQWRVGAAHPRIPHGGAGHRVGRVGTTGWAHRQPGIVCIVLKLELVRLQL